MLQPQNIQFFPMLQIGIVLQPRNTIPIGNIGKNVYFGIATQFQLVTLGKMCMLGPQQNSNW